MVADVEADRDLIITRRGEPVAAVIGVQPLHEIADLQCDLEDLAVVLGRSARDNVRRTSFDEVLQAFGHTRESLDAIPDE